MRLYQYKNKPLVFSRENVSSPVIYGNKIMWSNMDWTTKKENISIYDIPSERICNISHNWTNSSAIYEDGILWAEEHNGTTNLYMQDFVKHKISQIYTNWTGSYLNIYGDKIVWMNSSGVPGFDDYHSDIYMYNISTAETTRITNSTYASGPAIYGDKIVYLDSRSDPKYQEERDIYVYDLAA